MKIKLNEDIILSNSLNSNIEKKFALKFLFKFLKRKGLWVIYKKYVNERNLLLIKESIERGDENIDFNRNFFTFLTKSYFDMFLIQSLPFPLTRSEDGIDWDGLDCEWCKIMREKFGFDF